MSELLTRAITYTPDRETGLKRLEAFLPSAGSKYRDMRNFDFGPADRSNVSALSPWIRHRLVTERDVADAVLHRYALSSVEKFIQEVCWRTYWKGWLELRPSVWDRYVDERDRAIAALDKDASLHRRWQEATEGKTGIEGFDDWARELVGTGYLHNHARMWFASIWIFTLKLPWVLGADFFLRHLMDGDPASNTLSWRWVAGLQTRGKTYLARSTNIAEYTDGRFKPTGLAQQAPALVDAPFPEPLPLAQSDPLPESGKIFLLFTDDDCQPEDLVGKSMSIAGTAGWSLCAERSPFGVGERAKSFSAGALADAALRLEAKTGVHAVVHDGPKSIEELVNEIRASDAQTVLMHWTPQGWNRPHVLSLGSRLTQAGIGLCRHRRIWDSRAWPLATKGFFPFREKIPDLMRDAGFDIMGKMQSRN